MELTTEKDSDYDILEELPLADILESINNEDKSVTLAIKKSLHQIEALI